MYEMHTYYSGLKTIQDRTLANFKHLLYKKSDFVQCVTGIFQTYLTRFIFKPRINGENNMVL